MSQPKLLEFVVFFALQSWTPTFLRLLLISQSNLNYADYRVLLVSIACIIPFFSIFVKRNKQWTHTKQNRTKKSSSFKFLIIIRLSHSASKFFFFNTGFWLSVGSFRNSRKQKKAFFSSICSSSSSSKNSAIISKFVALIQREKQKRTKKRKKRNKSLEDCNFLFIFFFVFCFTIREKLIIRKKKMDSKSQSPKVESSYNYIRD